jgi:predicted metal-binding protein
MRSNIKEFVTKVKGQFSAKYGIEMDDWSSMVMAEISERFMMLNHSVEKSAGKIEEAARSVKGKTYQVSFNSSQEAFKLGLGLSAPLAGMCSLVAVLFFWYKTSTEEYQSIRQIAQSYENVRAYRILMQEGEIVQREGQYYLTLSLANKKAGDILIGKEYVFEGKKKRILVPLGR